MTTIAVVEDNADNRLLLQAILGDRYTLVEYDNGVDALAGLHASLPDLVLLDISLPGMDGNEVARRLRGRPEFEKTLIVALTGWGQEADVERSRAAGFDHHLVKPASPEAILELLPKVGEGDR